MVVNDAASNAAVRPVIRNPWLPRCAARRAGRRGLLLSKEAKRAQQKYETKQAGAAVTSSVPVEHMRENSGNHRFWAEILCTSVTTGLSLALRSNNLVITVKLLAACSTKTETCGMYLVDDDATKQFWQSCLPRRRFPACYLLAPSGSCYGREPGRNKQ
jgi:hypothetical protein